MSESYPVYNTDCEYLIQSWLKEDPEIDEKQLLERLDELLRSTTMIKQRYIGREVSWTLVHFERAYAFERAIHKAIEAMLDICRHTVSAKKLGLAEELLDEARNPVNDPSPRSTEWLRSFLAVEK